MSSSESDVSAANELAMAQQKEKMEKRKQLEAQALTHSSSKSMRDRQRFSPLGHSGDMHGLIKSSSAPTASSAIFIEQESSEFGCHHTRRIIIKLIRFQILVLVSRYLFESEN